MRMGRALQRKGKDRALARRIPLHVQPVEARKTRLGIVAQGTLMRRYIGHAEGHEIIERNAQPDLLHNAGGAGFELHRRIGVGDGILGDLTDHVAAAEEGPHLLHPLTTNEDRAGTAWSI